MKSETVRISVDLPRDLEKSIQRLCEKEMRSRHSQIIFLLDKAMKKETNEKEAKK